MFGVKKLRPDWQLKTYAIPISRIDIGDEFWNEAQIFKDAWNEIAAAYRTFDEQITALETELVLLKKEKLDYVDTNLSLKAIRAERRKKTFETAKSQSPKVFNSDLENLRIAVKSAINLAYKQNGTLRFKKGIQAVNFSKRYNAGGVKFKELLTELDSRSEKLLRRPLALRVGALRKSRRSLGKTLLHGHFLVGKSRVPVKFTGVWSYSFFPLAAVVKKATLVGKFSALRKWQWSLNLVIEEPPAKIERKIPMPIAGLDLGYRRFTDYIRFGFIVDSAGNKFELRLPLGNMLSGYLKRTAKFLAEKGVEKEYIKSLEDYFDWDAAQGSSLEEAKIQLTSLSKFAAEKEIEMSEKWREIFNDFSKIQNRGILKLKEIFVEILAAKDEIDKAERDLLKQTIGIIDTWQKKDFFYKTEKEHFRRKFLGRRKLLYRQTVKWLASNYSQIVCKEKLNLGAIATKAKKSSRLMAAALKDSNKFRHWAGLYQLKLFINERSSKLPNWLRAATSVYAPPVCGECGANDISNPAKLLFVCPNGHQQDKDEKTARHFLEQTANEICNGNLSVVIPPHLQENIVRID